jgi:hypothetical protein
VKLRGRKRGRNGEEYRQMKNEAGKKPHTKPNRKKERHKKKKKQSKLLLLCHILGVLGQGKVAGHRGSPSPIIIQGRCG